MVRFFKVGGPAFEDTGDGGGIQGWDDVPGLGRRPAVKQGPALQPDGVFCRCDSGPGGTCLEQALECLGVGCVQDQAAGGFCRPRTKVPGRALLWTPCSKVTWPDWMVAR